MKKQSDDKNKRCKLYLNQENQVNKYYSVKKKIFKNCIDEKINKFKDNYQAFKTFCSISSMYSENILKNIENLKKILSNFPIKNESNENESLVELERLIVSQLDGEKEKIERLIFNNNKDFKKGKPELEKKGKEISNQLYKGYHEYINLIDKLNISHVNYLKYFYDYEKKMIYNETKDIKEIEESDENLMPKNDSILTSLHSYEFQYKSTIENTNQNIKNIINEVNQCFEEYNKINNEISEIMESSMASIYLGYATSNKLQKAYDQKVLTLKRFNSNSLDDLQNSDNEDNIKLEKLCDNMQFKPYNLMSPYANIEGYKQQNKILEKLKPEIIYKISCIINSEFNYIPKVDLKEQYRIMDVKLICKRILEETSISKKEEEQLYQYLEERKYRLAFLAALNKIRTKGKFKIGKRSIIILGTAIKIIADKLYKEKAYDFEMIRYLIIMCQTYFSIGIDGKKIYLMRFIENSKYFKSEDLWNYYICEMIDREIDFQDSTNMWILEKTEEDEKYKMSKIYFGKLLSLTQNIMEFHLDKKIVYKIIHDLIDTKYNLTEDLTYEIDQLIEMTIYDEKKDFDPEKDILGINEDLKK